MNNQIVSKEWVKGFFDSDTESVIDIKSEFYSGMLDKQNLRNGIVSNTVLQYLTEKYISFYGYTILFCNNADIEAMVLMLNFSEGSVTLNRASITKVSKHICGFIVSTQLKYKIEQYLEPKFDSLLIIEVEPLGDDERKIDEYRYFVYVGDRTHAWATDIVEVKNVTMEYLNELYEYLSGINVK